MPDRAIAEKVWRILEGLGADPASEQHFLARWSRCPVWFGFSLQATPFTFRVEPSGWLVTSYLEDHRLAQANLDLLALWLLTETLRAA